MQGKNIVLDKFMIWHLSMYTDLVFFYSVMMRRHLTNEQVAQAVALSNDGRSQRYIANVLGVSHSVVGRVVQRHRETGRFTRRLGQGRRRCTTAREDRAIGRRALQERQATARTLAGHHTAVTDQIISAQTIRRRLREQNIRSRKPMKVPKMTAAHRANRMRFARAHVNWSMQRWRRILFTDESRFALEGCDGRVRVWRREQEHRNHPDCVAARTAFRSGSVMIWGGIRLNSKTPLVIIPPPALNAVRYRDEIVQPFIIPEAAAVGPHFQLMQDNARPHIAHLIIEYLAAAGIQTMEWPANSPDMNPIEHVWDFMGRKLIQLQPQPRNHAELSNALQNIWNNIPQAYINTLIRSCGRRCQAVLRARGGPTCY